MKRKGRALPGLPERDVAVAPYCAIGAYLPSCHWLMS